MLLLALLLVLLLVLLLDPAVRDVFGMAPSIVTFLTMMVVGGPVL